MFINDDLVKDARLTCCNRKQTKLEVHLVEGTPMRYILKLFYYNKLSYKSPWEAFFLFNSFAEELVWFNTEDGIPQGGWVCNNPWLKFHIIKVNKGKNKTMVKGHLFQVEC